MILVDTSIWSLAPRRRAAALSAEEERAVGEWARLVAEGMAVLIGPIRQEILSGIRRIDAFRALRRTLLVAYRHAIPVFAADTDYAMYARHLPLRLHLPRPSR